MLILLSTRTMIQCNICNKQFTHLCYLKNHMKVHTTDRPKSPWGPFCCITCKRRFTTYSDLAAHKQQFHPKTYPCPECGKVFDYQDGLRIHRIRHGERSFGCSVCEKMFKIKPERDQHYKAVHLNIRPYKCDLCDFKGATISSFLHCFCT